MISQFIKTQLNISNETIVNKIRDHLIEQTNLDPNDVLIDGNAIICKDMEIPSDTEKYLDFYPIEEWSSEIEIDGHNIKIIYGFDWFGIRYNEDPYCNYITMKKID